jgi:2-phospho-L-lactate transferase/gluconeogenesis factor (CofD/UPF0052 family)
MWQPWETMNYSAFDHVEALLRHAGFGKHPKGFLDRLVVNTTPLRGSQRRLYAAEKVYPVAMDLPRIEELGLPVLARPLLAAGEKVRHDPEAIARVAMELAAEGRYRR